MKKIVSIIIGGIGSVMVGACASVVMVPVVGPLSQEPNLGEIALEPTVSRNNISKFSYRIKGYDKCNGLWSSNSPTIDCEDGHKAYIRVFNNDLTAIGLVADTRGNIFRINARLEEFAPSSVGLCMDESVAYAICMVTCEAGGVSRDDCDRDHCWDKSGAATDCVMEKLRNQHLDLIDFIEHIPPQVPIPLPSIPPDP